MAPKIWVDTLVIAALTLLGLGLRLIALGRESFWLDEAGRAAIAQLPLAAIPHAVGVIELSPPFYHLILHVWVRLFGGSDTTIRLLSALLVLPTVPLAAMIGDVVSARRGRWLVAGLAATSPIAVHYGQEAAMYAIVLPLGLLALRGALGVMVGPQATRARWLVVYVVSGTMALYTHYYAGFLLLSVLAVGVWHSLRRRARHGVILWIAAHALIALAFVPWIPTFLGQVGLAASVDDWSAVPPLDALGRWADAVMADGAPGWGIPALVVLLAGLALGGYAVRGRPPLGTLLGTLVVLPLVLAIGAAGFLHSFRERGFLAVIGAPWALIAAGIAPEIAPRWVRAAGLALLSATAVLTVVGLRAHYTAPKEDWRSAASVIEQRAGPDDPIFIVHYAGELALDRYLMGPQPRIGLPQDFDWSTGYTARYQVTADDVTQRVPPALATANRAWAVLSHEAGRGSEYLTAALDQWGAQTGEWQLSGVRVLRYDRQ